VVVAATEVNIPLWQVHIVYPSSRW